MQPRLAVFIDAENLRAEHWPELRKKIDALGTMTSCRLFGDFSGNRHASWIARARDEGLQAIMQFTGPNASDIAITIAAIDTVYTAKVEGICLASSDRDFTPLVQRLRLAGLKVYGFGEAKTAQALRKACTDFHVLTLPKPKLVSTQPKKKSA